MANWRQRFIRPIRLGDGTELLTLRDAANWIIQNKPPNSAIAIERLMEAAERGGSLEAAETAVRLALFAQLDFGTDQGPRR